MAREGTRMSYDNDYLRSLVRDDRVHGSIYTDPMIFEIEMEKIFGRVWVFVGHESQVPNPGDYFCTDIARMPVVMTRGMNGAINVIFNRCSHRGAKVVNSESGNAKVLVCMYHGWGFGLDGELKGVPLHKDFPEQCLDRREAGMGALPRVENYRGFVFASLNPEVGPLADYLGEAARGIDEIVDRSPDGAIELSAGCHRYVYDGNWKLQMDNLADMYHPVACHMSTVDEDGLQFKRRPGEAGGRAAFLGADGEPVAIKTGVRGFANGHSSEASLFGDTQGGAETHQRGGVIDEYRASLIALHGQQKTDDILKNRRHSMTLFPNLDILMVQTAVRVVIPIAWNRTEVRVYPVRLKGAPEELNKQIIQFCNITHSAASFIQTDDLEAFRRQQEGLAAPGPEWVLVARGYGDEIDEGNGVFFGPRASEVGQRMRHYAWRDLMTA
ncbi:putative ring-hydroxylating dioxygenase large subunit [Paraburkholderia piptadeniae]|uniref:Ring-hydroxylating dioxygenase large subunit n=2 Tax=Paraburkholderia piptadeniae TaxID=1701573 RepID=A0A1N7S095_9BURK|nr:putative ring-hydroxylating dioxygenase large subunit [Paraburkholderia piptadeniae]